jgi:drug/metabolite transporter (DMT)-like permease
MHRHQRILFVALALPNDSEVLAPLGKKHLGIRCVQRRTATILPPQRGYCTMSSPPKALSVATSESAAPWSTPLELLALGAIWGASFLFMRVASAPFGPVALVEVRLTLGALILAPFLWRARTQLNGKLWLRLAIVGAVNSAIPFTLFAWAARHAPAGIGAIANATAVMFTALVAFAFYGERIGKRRAVALALGFVGVAVLASGKVAGGSVWLPALAGTFAAFLYGIGANLSRQWIVGLPASAVAAATLLCASALWAPFAVIAWPNDPIDAKAWTSAALLGLVCTGVAYLLYFRLLYRIGAPRASTVTYLVPAFAVLWAWALLGEPLTATMAGAGALILAGVAMSQKSG